jgi:hypothetical protein
MRMRHMSANALIMSAVLDGSEGVALMKAAYALPRVSA